MARRRTKSEFSEGLARLRKERGYASAYSFFHGNGGVRKFGFTYSYYLLIERSVRLPSLRALKTIAGALGLGSPGFLAERRELLRLFIRASVDGDPAFDAVFEGARGKSAEGAGGEEEIMQRAARQRLKEVPIMSLEQATALGTNPVAFWAFQWLLQTGRRASARGLASDLGYPEADVSFALGTLADLKLVQRRRDGSYSCPYFETDLFAPPSSVTPEKILWSSEQIQKRIRPGEPGLYYGNYFLAVETPETLAALANLFRDAIRKGYLLRHPVEQGRGHLVAVEARISPLISL